MNSVGNNRGALAVSEAKSSLLDAEARRRRPETTADGDRGDDRSDDDRGDDGAAGKGAGGEGPDLPSSLEEMALFLLPGGVAAPPLLGADAGEEKPRTICRSSGRRAARRSRPARPLYDSTGRRPCLRLVGIGRPSLRVPSIVEDAHFACVRAVERAAGTRSEMAVRTVGCGVCELRGFGDDDGEVEGVRRALAEAVRCSGGEGADPFDADGELCLGNFRLVGAGRKNAKEDESLGRDIGAKCKNAKDAESSGGNVGAGSGARTRRR